MFNLLPTINISLNGLYIDPASTSVLLSSLTAIGVALGATLMIFWRNFKKKFSKVIDLDERDDSVEEAELKISYEDFVSEEVAVSLDPVIQSISVKQKK